MGTTQKIWISGTNSNAKWCLKPRRPFRDAMCCKIMRFKGNIISGMCVKADRILHHFKHQPSAPEHCSTAYLNNAELLVAYAMLRSNLWQVAPRWHCNGEGWGLTAIRYRLGNQNCSMSLHLPPFLFKPLLNSNENRVTKNNLKNRVWKPWREVLPGSE